METTTDLKITSCLDTEYIQVKNNISALTSLLIELFNKNNLLSQKIESDNQYANESRVLNKNNTRETLFHINYNAPYSYKNNGKVISRDESLLLKFAGTGSLIQETDTQRNNALNQILDLLKPLDVDYGFTELDLAFDIEADTTIDNFLPIKLTKGININNPHNYIGTKSKGQTLPIESNYSKTRAYHYEKSKKENLSGKTIHRFEIKLSKLHDISRNPYELIDYIEKQLNAYKLFYFQDIDLCNQFKEQYSKNITKKDSPNVPDKLLRDLRVAAKEIELKLSDEIKKFIINTLSRPEQLKSINPKSEIRKIISKLPKKKEKTIPTQKEKISFYQILNLSIKHTNPAWKKYVLQLQDKFNSLSIYPLILKVFPPTNKAPPIIN